MPPSGRHVPGPASPVGVDWPNAAGAAETISSSTSGPISSHRRTVITDPPQCSRGELRPAQQLDDKDTTRHGGARAAATSRHAGSALDRARPSRGKTLLALLTRGIGSPCYRRWRWMTTASTMMIPLRMAWYSDWILRRPRILSRMLSVSAPIIEPTIVPTPPARLVP